MQTQLIKRIHRNRRLSHVIILAIAFVFIGLGLGAGSSVNAASTEAGKFCKSYNGAAQKACEYGYDHNDDKNITKLCKDKFKSNSGACSAGQAASMAQKSLDPVGQAATDAKGDPAADPNAECSKNRCDFIKKYVNPFINLLSISFGFIAVISIIMGGIQYSGSRGDPQNVTLAKQRISRTILAIVVYFFLYAFLQFIIPGGIFKR
ncbi:hypothetical protein COY17_04140 [Candidatus Saccharibacteria bacterium CG_4_10_14_0_2_um_filter_52_9]|nr:MAG: hypothetical protein COY17_04140 [Candidatus Saccharibacteria bacterium CG_4_10_14_0_2_um_filter_52_9]